MTHLDLLSDALAAAAAICCVERLAETPNTELCVTSLKMRLCPGGRCFVGEVEGVTETGGGGAG